MDFVFLFVDLVDKGFFFFFNVNSVAFYCDIANENHCYDLFMTKRYIMATTVFAE